MSAFSHTRSKTHSRVRGIMASCHWRSKSVQLRRNKTVHLLISELKLRGCADAGHGGVPRVARFIQPGIEHK